MKRRIKRTIAFIMAISLAPIWAIFWLFTGKPILFTLLEFACNDEN